MEDNFIIIFPFVNCCPKAGHNSMKKEKENQTVFLRKIGKIEFILFIFSFAGIILNAFTIKGESLCWDSVSIRLLCYMCL